MSSKIKYTFFGLTAFIILFIGLHYLCPGSVITLEIPKGASAGQAANILKTNNVILSSNWFKLLVKVTDSGKRIMPGKYLLRTHMSSEEALYKLVTTIPLAETVDVVIPEGWRMEQVAERLKANGVIESDDEFVRLAKEQNLEGYLFPSKYEFKKNILPQEAVNVLKLEFERQIRPLFSEGFAEGLDEKKTMIIASIVEREAVVDSERPLIAAVYINRLRINKRLEADPTTQYAIGYDKREQTYWKKGLTYKDLKIKSPYNTYQSDGLPPGPICSPGKSSVTAVLKPADFDALYFVSDKLGRHIFNRKFEEHKKAIRYSKMAEKERLKKNKGV